MGSIDEMFAQLLTPENPWATIIAGFIIVLIILFFAISIFGKNKQQVGSFGIVIIIFIASILATALGLFPVYVLLIFLVLSLVAIIFKLMLGGRSGQ